MKIERLVMSVGGLTLISRIFGYIRDIAIAFYLGASLYNDAFIIALRLPNMFRSIFAEGALSSVFIPIFTGKIKKEGKVKALAFASNIQILLIIALIICSIIVMYYMHFVISFLARGYVGNTELIQLATNLGLISFPYIIFISLTAFYGGISNSLGNYLAFATAPIILNLMLIAFIFFGNTPIEKTYWLTISLPIAGIIEMMWVMYFVYRKVGWITLKMPIFNQDTKIFFKRFCASIIGSGITQINLVISTTIGSFTISGISYLYYADRIYQLPLALIGTALGIVILPELTRRHVKLELNKFRIIQYRASTFVLYTTLPCAVVIFALSQEIIAALFQYGAFDQAATIRTAEVLKIFALGLPMYCFMKIFSSAFFSIGDTKTPVQIAAFSLIINIFISFALLFKFQHVAVAIASVTTAYVSVGLMLYIQYKKGFYIFYKRLLRISLKLILISLMLYVIILVMKQTINIQSPVVALTIYLLITAIIYIGICQITKAYSLKGLLKDSRE